MLDKITYLQNKGFVWNYKLNVYQIPNGPAISREQVEMTQDIIFMRVIDNIITIWRKANDVK
jgi:hypothetical protein